MKTKGTQNRRHNTSTHTNSQLLLGPSAPLIWLYNGITALQKYLRGGAVLYAITYLSKPSLTTIGFMSDGGKQSHNFQQKRKEKTPTQKAEKYKYKLEKEEFKESSQLERERPASSQGSDL